MCPSLTLQQIYKLSEHHHDDWITAVGDNQGTKTIVLLETLKRAVDSSGGMATPPPASPMRSMDDGPRTPFTPGGGPNPYPSPASISSTHHFEDEDNLLLDSQVRHHSAEFPVLCHIVTSFIIECLGEHHKQTLFQLLKQLPVLAIAISDHGIP